MKKILWILALVLFFSSPVVSEDVSAAAKPKAEPYLVEPDW
ncbi:hypothetical protein [Brevibacillus parabrevis]|nr:hypothetical protein [Brevibacillus parabrevis]